jgi:CBS domain-containing protein
MVSRSDVLRWMREGWPAGATLGEGTGRRELFVAYADELAGHLADRMAAADIGRAPVVERDSGRLVGLVARRDLLQVRVKTASEELTRSKLLHLPGLG